MKMIMLLLKLVGKYLRFDTQDIAHPPCFISVLLVSLADRVDVVYTENPFVLFKLDLSAKVVQMLY